MDDKRYTTSGRFMVLFISLLLMASVLGGSSFNTFSSHHERFTLVYTSDIPSLKGYGVDIVEVYDGFVMVKGGERLEDLGYNVRELQDRTKLYINGYQFDFTEGEPDIDERTRYEGYSEGTLGQYIMHMYGPIKQQWRDRVEDIGVQVLSHIPNHAYRVRMTPEQAEEVSDLKFVDWMGLYHPAYKIQRGTAPGIVDIKLVPGAGWDVIDEMCSDFSVNGIHLSTDGIYRLSANVSSYEELHSWARNMCVYHISQRVEIGLLDEMATQIIGGGLWFTDDDPENAYRGYGNYGSYMNQLGYRGDGVTIAVADTGIGDGTVGNAGHQDFTGRVVGGYSFDEGGWEDGHGHGTHCTGSIAGDTYHGSGDHVYNDYYIAQGSAPDSELFAVKLFDSGGGSIAPEDPYEIIQVAAQHSDAYLHSNSWGSSVGGYDELASAFDSAVRNADRDSSENRPMVITVAAGNQGPQDETIYSPGTGKNVITVGASQNYNPDREMHTPENMLWSSSRGWTDDARVKPDVIAPGQSIFSTMPDGGYGVMSGTSMANPAVAGAASVVVDWYEQNMGYRPSPAMVKALLINTANQIEGDTRGAIPNQDEGWGMVDISKLESPIDSPVPFYTYDEDTIFTDSGEVDEQVILSDRKDLPLKITLTWTDAAASAGSSRALVNDLDLEVESPTGKVYRGNAFDEGWTLPNHGTMSDFDHTGDGWDDTNNVENVYIHPDELEIGEYKVRVIASNIADDSVGVGENSQDFALAAYNARQRTDDDMINMITPDGGESWDAHTQQEIRWETSGKMGWVDILYSIDGGSSWTNIDIGVQDKGTYVWDVPNENSSHCLVKVRVVDDEGRMDFDISSTTFDINGVPPRPPENPSVSLYGEGLETLFYDDIESENKGYTTSSSHSEASPWDIRQNGAVEGEHSWDWGDGSFEKLSDQGMLSWLISPEIIIPETSDVDHGVTLTFHHWRDFGDTSLYDGGNLKISGQGIDGPYEVIIPEGGYDGTIEEDYGNPLGGEPGWGGVHAWEEVKFDLTDYIGESVHIRWDAGTEEWDDENGAGWRIDNISIDALVMYPEGDEDNLINWYASGCDHHGISHYNVYRSDSRDGPWSIASTVDADGSNFYRYIDEGFGASDGVRWWYLVRAVGENGMEEDNVQAVREPGEEIISMNISLEFGWNFISFNLHPLNTDIRSIVEDEEYGIADNYDKILYHDPQNSRWRSYVPDRDDRFNTIDTWDLFKGIWIRVTDEDTLTLRGYRPTITYVTLRPGWNMVGVPASQTGNHDLPLEIDRVGYMDTSAEYHIRYNFETGSFDFQVGEGYLIHNPTDHNIVWEIAYDG